MSVYLDNAATTQIDERVLEAMMPHLTEHFGNPSSIHSHGRFARSAIEKARRQVAELLNAAPAEIFFTSGGTESDNTVIRGAIAHYGLRHAITSKIEHHAVLHTLEHLEKEGIIKLHFVELDNRGQIKYEHLEKLLKSHENAFVSLMHANNEIGNVMDLERVGDLCHESGAYFHSDTVQSIGNLELDFLNLKLHAAAGSAHKFHGPKGIGLMYLNAEKTIPPMITGGAQERDMRGGTENVAGIVGMSEALRIAHEEQHEKQAYLRKLKEYTIRRIHEQFPRITFNGLSGDLQHSLHKILSLAIPGIEDNDMLLFNLDINGISVSGGSACASGTSIGSHVLDELHLPPNTGAVRLSFSKYNTKEDVDRFVEELGKALGG